MGNSIDDHQKVDAILVVLPTLAIALAEAEQWLSCRQQVKQLTETVERVSAQALRVSDRRT